MGSYLLLGKGADYDAYQAESGHVEWHKRGHTNKLFEKCPLKLSLKDETGNSEKEEQLCESISGKCAEAVTFSG